MHKSVLTVVSLAVSGFVAMASAAAHEPIGPEVRISMLQARTIALRIRPGKIVREELERERGGSGLRYSFDIKSGRDTHEVGIDAVSGKVLENSLDNAATD